MHIDENIERRVRAAFSAVIGRRADDLRDILGALNTRDFQTAVTYAVYACGYVVLDVLDESLPDAGVEEIARDVVVENKDWFDLGDPETIARFLKAAGRADLTFPDVPEEDVAGHAFVVGGFLVARYRHDGQRWYEYLDDIWNNAVAVPEQ